MSKTSNNSHYSELMNSATLRQPKLMYSNNSVWNVNQEYLIYSIPFEILGPSALSYYQLHNRQNKILII